MKLSTAVALALALGSAALSVNMASADVQVGTFKEGLDVGTRNGGLIAQRLYNKLIAKNGCAALGDFENALSLVSSRISGPTGKGGKFIAGFFQGYLNALSLADEGARKDCSEGQFTDGSFPGELFGNIFCQVAGEAPEALSDLQFGPIYNGWSAGSSVLKECAASFNSVAGACADSGIAAQLLGSAQSAACSDAQVEAAAATPAVPGLPSVVIDN